MALGGLHLFEGFLARGGARVLGALLELALAFRLVHRFSPPLLLVDLSF